MMQPFICKAFILLSLLSTHLSAAVHAGFPCCAGRCGGQQQPRGGQGQGGAAAPPQVRGQLDCFWHACLAWWQAAVQPRLLYRVQGLCCV